MYVNDHARVCRLATYLYEFGSKLSQALHWLPGPTIVSQSCCTTTLPSYLASMLYIFEWRVLDMLSFLRKGVILFRRILHGVVSLSLIWLFSISNCNTIFDRLIYTVYYTILLKLNLIAMQIIFKYIFHTYIFQWAVIRVFQWLRCFRWIIQLLGNIN